MQLTREEETILAGGQGDLPAKLLKLIVKLGESYGADKLIPITSAHTVLNFGHSFITSAAKILHNIADAGLKVSVPTTADPVVDKTFSQELANIMGMFPVQDQVIEDLTRIGVRGFTCTPYLVDNRPKFGDHCAWAESSAVVYINSVLGARTNREGGVLDIASAIIGKTPNYGLHLQENRKGQVLFKIHLNNWEDIDLTSLGLRIGEIAGAKIPVIDGLKDLTPDGLKNLGAASAASGAVALIHVVGLTPEAKTLNDAFQGEKPEDVVDVDRNMLSGISKKYSTEWPDAPKNIGIGCPHLSESEVGSILTKLEGKQVSQGRSLWICCSQAVKDVIMKSQYRDVVQRSGVKITTMCPLLTPLPRPYTTNSGKTCAYTNASYRSIDECIRLATGEGK